MKCGKRSQSSRGPNTFARHCICTVPVKSLDTHSRVFLYFYYYLHFIITVKTSKHEITHMELCSNQKSVKQIKLYFRFFKVATLCLDDSFAHSWHSLNQVHEKCFSNSFDGVPTYAEHLLAAIPSLGPTPPKPSQLG